MKRMKIDGNNFLETSSKSDGDDDKDDKRVIAVIFSRILREILLFLIEVKGLLMTCE